MSEMIQCVEDNLEVRLIRLGQRRYGHIATHSCEILVLSTSSPRSCREPPEETAGGALACNGLSPRAPRHHRRQYEAVHPSDKARVVSHWHADSNTPLGYFGSRTLSRYELAHYVTLLLTTHSELNRPRAIHEALPLHGARSKRPSRSCVG
ncbi:hypothetical protein GCM10009767_06230 [Kocuria aegyptia]|uniref:Uncharacterized protein n=1 Tax=Kocuria aegyptia TaxID=330943 RepID=A0ABN2K7V4_9MICC